MSFEYIFLEKSLTLSMNEPLLTKVFALMYGSREKHPFESEFIIFEIIMLSAPGLCTHASLLRKTITSCAVLSSCSAVSKILQVAGCKPVFFGVVFQILDHWDLMPICQAVLRSFSVWYDYLVSVFHDSRMLEAIQHDTQNKDANRHGLEEG